MNRETYYHRFLTQYCQPGDVNMKAETLKRYSKGAKGWKTIEERILAGEGYAPENILLNYEEEVSKLESEITFLKEKLVDTEDNLNRLKNMSDSERNECDKKTKKW